MALLVLRIQPPWVYGSKEGLRTHQGAPLVLRIQPL